ncbi:MAG: UbiD family decarboxylase [Chloroflexi bacterium]|nr:UbiD family decarboxylase [Chloroflexota bacterium]
MVEDATKTKRGGRDYQDLREWLALVAEIGMLRAVRGADWNLEIGTLAELNAKRERAPSLLFDEIKDYPPGYRVTTGALLNAATLGLALRLPTEYSDRELVEALREKIPEWEAKAEEYPPQFVERGTVTENMDVGKAVDLLKFPAPFWHELDGGRYIGTGCAVITRDPDTGLVNLGTYRIMLHDKTCVGFYASPGKHGNIHRAKYHARGEPCPVAISLGHDPLLLAVGAVEIPLGVCEYNYAGAIRGKPMRVIKSDVTGLPIPADAEVVIEGWCPPSEERLEGPFGEWTGYYAGGREPAPIINVAAVRYRDSPIILGCPPNRPPNDHSYLTCVFRSALLHEALVKAGVPDVRGVWRCEAGGSRLWVVVSIKQRYAGHARQAGFVAAQCQQGAYLGRYIIVVDEDIDPFNMNDVIWALSTRSDPEKDIDFVRRAWSSRLDPMIPKPAAGYFNSRAVIDACRPFEWMRDFPKVSEASPEVAQRVREKWREVLS